MESHRCLRRRRQGRRRDAAHRARGLRGLAKRQPVVGQAIGLRVAWGYKQAHKKATKLKKLSIGASLASVLRLGTASKKPGGRRGRRVGHLGRVKIEAAIEKLVQQIRDETDLLVTALEAELEYAEALVVSMAVDITTRSRAYEGDELGPVRRGGRGARGGALRQVVAVEEDRGRGPARGRRPA